MIGIQPVSAMQRTVRLATLAVALVTLAGCGPRPNDPPTDSEIFSGLSSFWNEQAPTLSRNLNQDLFGLLKPLSAKRVGDGETQDTAMGKMHMVTVSYSYQATAELTYQCDPGVTTHIRVTSDTRNPLPQSANAGDAISCDGPVLFTKIDQGWIMNFGMPGIGYSYLIKR